MQGKEILIMADIISNEKNISKNQVFEALEHALATAIRKELGKHKFKAKIDPKTGNISISKIWEVVSDNEEHFDPLIHLYDDQAEEKFNQNYKVGDVIEEPIEYELGRQSAQIFKQSIKDNLFKAQKAENQKNYEKRVGEVFLTVVKKFSKGDVIVSINDEIEGIIPFENVIPGERFKIGQKINVVLYKIVENYKGQQLIFDRASKEYVEGMMMKEIPEVGNENIVIRSIARKAGAKTLVLVESVAPYVDALRECIGNKGIRIKFVSENMNGESIELFEAKKDNIETYLNVLKPAEPISIYINDEESYIDVALSEEDIQRINGKTGLRFELIKDLIGMDLYLMTEDEFNKKQNQNVESIIDNFIELLNIDEDFAVALVEEGFEDLTSIAYAPEHILLQIEGIDNEVVKLLQSQAKQALSQEIDEKYEKSGLNKFENFNKNVYEDLLKSGVETKEDLAELSVYELLDIVKMEEEEAAKLIMEARKDWF